MEFWEGKNSDADSELVSIDIPVGYDYAGSTLDENTSDFDFDYHDSNGTLYRLDPGENFSLNITEWERGGKAKGTFSGTLDNYGTTISITEGTFECKVD